MKAKLELTGGMVGKKPNHTFFPRNKNQGIDYRQEQRNVKIYGLES